MQIMAIQCTCNLMQFSSFFLQCSHTGVNEGDETLHLISHVTQHSPMEMQAYLVHWIDSHLAWLRKISAHILDKKKLGIEDYLSTLVSKGAPIDEIGILIFSWMYHIHVCMLLKGYFWTTNENKDQDQCHLTLVY